MGRRGRFAAGVAAATLVAGVTSACAMPSGPGGGSPDVPDEIVTHEGGPEAPITAGLTVPAGAVQLGPLVRYRSDRLVTAYQPELNAALTQRGVRDAVSAARSNDTGELAATPPVITKNSRPDDDSYALLDEPPPADVTVALMRLDSDQVQAVESMVQQIEDLLPDAGVDADDFASYCTLEDIRITGCDLTATGTAADGRQLQVTMQVDPGDLDTRISAPSTQTHPVMQLRVEDLSDPRVEPVASATTEETPAPEPVEETEGAAGSKEVSPEIIFPAMDLQAPADTPLLNGWVAPDDVTILLSGYDPSFVALHVPSSAEARDLARTYVESLAPDVTVRTDSFEALNEVDVTFTATAPDGSHAVGTHIITARGNYVMLFYRPAS